MGKCRERHHHQTQNHDLRVASSLCANARDVIIVYQPPHHTLKPIWCVANTMWGSKSENIKDPCHWVHDISGQNTSAKGMSSSRSWGWTQVLIELRGSSTCHFGIWLAFRTTKRTCRIYLTTLGKKWLHSMEMVWNNIRSPWIIWVAEWHIVNLSSVTGGDLTYKIGSRQLQGRNCWRCFGSFTCIWGTGILAGIFRYEVAFWMGDILGGWAPRTRFIVSASL